MHRIHTCTSIATAVCLVTLAAVVGACGEKDPYVGVMSDTSYAGQVTPTETIKRVNASGRLVSVDEFAGRFVWAEYAAPWCSPCIPQARTIRQLDRAYGGSVTFLTVLTSIDPATLAVPDEKDARSWADRMGLDAERVVAATNLYGRKIPSHLLFSPEGHTLFRHEGLLSRAYIEDVLDDRMAAWEAWRASGVTAKWMRDD